MTNADFLAAERIRIQGRPSIMGCSHGGYVVMVAMTKYDDLFATGANPFGMVNFETLFTQSTPWIGAIRTGE